MRARWLQGGDEIEVETLVAQGVVYARLPVDDPEGYQPTLDALRVERGYVTQDEVALSPSTPNLDELCRKFDGEHLHTEDEVRFVLEGEGVFDIRADDERWMRVVVEPGDLIVVPARRYHRFELTESRTIRCLRLFKDPAGWVAHYRD